MVTALIIVAGLCGLVLLLLAVPVRLVFRIERVEALDGQLTIGWLFGWLRLRVRIPGERKTAADAKSGTRARKAPARRSAHRDVFVVLREAAFRRRVYRLVRDLFAAAHGRDLRLHARLGLGDPADTGRLWALVGPLNAMARNLRHADVRIEPEFVDSVAEFRASGRLRVIPLQVLLLAIGFALSPASIGAWRALAGGHA